MWDGSSWLKWRSMALFVRLCLPSISPSSLGQRLQPPGPVWSSSSIPPSTFSWPSSPEAQVSSGGSRWNFGEAPEGRNLSSSGLTTSSNMVWLVVNGCNGSHCAVVWNRWRSPCCWCLAAQSVWEVFDTNEASSLQNQEQMVLENEAPLRSIETPSNDPPHTSFSPPHTLCFSLLPSLSSINEPFSLPRLFKSTCYCSHRFHVFKIIIKLNMDNGIRIWDISSSQWGRRVLWVVCWYEFLFTWMEPADGRVGSGPLQGMCCRPAADSQENSHISWSTHCLCAFNPPQIHVCML